MNFATNGPPYLNAFRLLVVSYLSKRQNRGQKRHKCVRSKNWKTMRDTIKTGKSSWKTLCHWKLKNLHIKDIIFSSGRARHLWWRALPQTFLHWKTQTWVFYMHVYLTGSFISCWNKGPVLIYHLLPKQIHYANILWSICAYV